MIVASGRAVVGFKLAGPITFSHTKHAHEELLSRTFSEMAAHHRANFIDNKVSNVVLEFSAIVNTRCLAIPY